MDNIICCLKGFNGQAELYGDRIIVSHHKNQQEIPFSQIERIQFKRGGMEQGLIQFTVIDNAKVCNNLNDITHDENSITFGYPKNSEAEQFKYHFARLCNNKPINILKNVKDIQQFNPEPTNETVVRHESNKLLEHREQFIARARAANPKMFDAADKKERRAELDKQDIVYCPKCLSTQLSVGQKGFGVGNAAAGAFLTGNLLGLAAGAIGSNKVRITCLKCGHKFYPGKK